MNEENGNGKQKTIFGIPCKGCTDRAEIMGAGSWRTDALILVALAAVISGILLVKYTNISD